MPSQEQAPFENDGAIPYGSRLIAFNTGTGTVTVVCENVNVRRPSNVAKRYGEIHQPTGSVAVKDFDEFTALMQLPSNGSGGIIEPQRGWTCTVTFDATGDADSNEWYITEVGDVETNNDIKKANITCLKIYN